MKRFISLVVLLVSSFMIIGCGNEKETEYDRAVQNFESNNYKMVMKMEPIPLFGSLTITSYLDDNVTKSVTLFGTVYTEEVDGVCYMYTESLTYEGKYTKETVACEETEEDVEFSPDDFNIKWFEKVDGTYKLKENSKDEFAKYQEDNSDEDGIIKDMEFKIIDDHFTEIKMTMELDELGEINATIKFSEYDEVEVTLPSQEQIITN